jgi:isoleucyl-tRNA synthetase
VLERLREDVHIRGIQFLVIDNFHFLTRGAKDTTAEEAAALRKSEQLILEELNAKELRIVEDETEVVSYDVKPNLPMLGRKYGAAVATIRTLLGTIPPAVVADTVRRGQRLTLDGYELEPEDIVLQALDRWLPLRRRRATRRL